MKISQKKTPTLLIADDEPAARFILREIFKDDYALIEAKNGLQAIDQVHTHKPDLLLLDVKMPGLDGIRVCQQLREKGNDMPIIIMTSYDEAEAVNLAFEAGATDFVTKPIHWSLLAQRIRYALRDEVMIQKIKKSNTMLDMAQSIAKMGHWHLDIDTMVWNFSKNVLRLLNINPDTDEKFKFQQFLELIDKEPRKELEYQINLSIEDRKQRQYELPWSYQIKNENQFIGFHWQVNCNTEGKAIELHGIIQDVTERKKAEAIIEHQAFYDHLTNLPNRRLFKELITRSMQISNRTERLLAILFIDCDRFKPINEALGHHSGDALLQSIADRLQKCVRTTDTVYRVSGDEFAVLLEDINHISVVDNIAKDIIDTIAVPHEINGHKVFTSVSVGISIYPFDENDEGSDLLAYADMAMYHAKRKGGNQFTYYNAEMNAGNARHLQLIEDLREALDRKEFQIFYQPQNSIDGHRLMVGVEALLRWHHPVRGWISPRDFIPIAEETGLIVPLGEWVINTACQQAAEWKRQGYGDIRMGVNLSPRQFNQANLVEVVERAISRAGIHPCQLDLEITESISMQNIGSTINILNDLKRLGVKISLDDFGTGYSSLSYLQKMSIDTLKIDQTFTRNLHVSNNNRAFVIAIITMGHSLNMKVIAEGVENEEQFQFLKKMGCDIAQGYLFSKPVPPDQLESFLLALVDNSNLKVNTSD